jgi:hypothetical protein
MTKFSLPAREPLTGTSEASPGTAVVITLWGLCPWSENISDYDRHNIYLYAELLSSETEGASEEDLARQFFELHWDRSRALAIGILRSHLRRAHWIADHAFPMLGW